MKYTRRGQRSTGLVVLGIVAVILVVPIRGVAASGKGVGALIIALSPVVLVAAVFAAIFFSARSGDLADVQVVGATVVITPKGANRWWATRARLEVPLSCVRSARVGDAEGLPLGFRFPGTSLPGVMVAGSFGLRAQRAFWLIGQGRRVLILELDGFEYHRIVVEVANPDAALAAIEASTPSATQ